MGDSGNAADTRVMTDGTTGYGAVADVYRISKYETTNAQYAEFLNAVAAADPNRLYEASMANPNPEAFGRGGITRSGPPESRTYSVIAGREDMPVNYVNFYDSLRFANWLHNGQPTGVQDSTTTEDGAYDMSLGSSVVRKAGAKVFLTSEDEWYKAAYYAGLGTYYAYPAGSNTRTTCALPGATANTANCYFVEGDLTDAGSYTGSASPSGSFDQGGNVYEWNEAVIGSDRGLRGGDFTDDSLIASIRFSKGPSREWTNYGFRVASLAPPRLPSLSPAGIALLGGLVFAIAVAALAVQRRRSAG